MSLHRHTGESPNPELRARTTQSRLTESARSEQVQLSLDLAHEESGQTSEQQENSGNAHKTESRPPGSAISAEAVFCRARTISASIPTEDRLAFARGFAFDAMSAYWSGLQARKGHTRLLLELPPDIELAPVPEAARKLAQAIGAAAPVLSTMRTSYLIGGIYTVAMPDKLRMRLGAYYTPPELCERLLDMAMESGVDWRSARVLDPACGGGAFLSAVARRMADRMNGCDAETILKNVNERLRGFELDPFAAWMAQVFLEATLDDLCQATGMRPRPVVRVCDALTQVVEDGGFDLVVGNPPYGRITPPRELRDVYRRSLYGHANLYGLFTDLALRFTRLGGTIAYVTPTSFLAGMYFKALRGLLGREAPPMSVGFVEARKGVFADVLQETLLATYSRGGRPCAAPVHFLSPNPDGSIKTTAAGRFRLPEPCDRPWFIPRTPRHSKLIRRVEALPHRLADYGYTESTGPLVWNRHKSSLRDVGGKKRFPVIWAESVRLDGVFEFRAQKRNHRPYFEPQADENWLMTDFSCVLLQRTTAKEQGRRLIAAELPARFLAKHRFVAVENHLNMIKPKGETPSVSPAAVARLLNSDVVDQLFRCINGSVAVSAYELEALPLPPPESMREFENLVARQADRQVVEKAVARLYGIEGP